MLLRICVCLFAVIQFNVNADPKKFPNEPFVRYVSIPVSTADESWTVSAQYRLPKVDTSNPIPAVVILHSSAGVDKTGRFYAKKLNAAGIATLELDLWGARGIMGGSADRPDAPQQTLPDAYAALHYLVAKTEIDNTKIGVLGFSWGGVNALLTATNQYNSLTGSPYKFAAHVAHYPVCWLYNNVPSFEFENLTGSPILIQSGDKDDYDLPDTCINLVNNLPVSDQELVSVKMYKKAYHAWDRLEQEIVVQDPTAHLGQGGDVLLSPNKRIAKKSRKKAVKFFETAFSNQ